ncbi:MAG: helix-hairpin-helix domain-containing protein [Flavitalea sp.]
MAIDNYQIAAQFSMLSKLMDVHGENSFKSKSYSMAAFNIDKLPVQLSELPPDKLFSIQGIGESTGKKIIEIIKNGHLTALENLYAKTPAGILEMLSIKGLGPKKIAVIWKEMEIESPGELLYACIENRLARYKGFGEKSQQSICDAIAFYQKSQGNHLYAQLEACSEELNKIFNKSFPKHLFAQTGAFRMQQLTINKLEWVTTVPIEKLQEFFKKEGYTEEDVLDDSITVRGPEKILIQFHSREKELFYRTLFETSSSEEFLNAWNKISKEEDFEFSSEEEIFKRYALFPVPPYLRETSGIIEKARTENFKNIIQPGDIKGIIHSHSDWSDGSNTIEQMAKACIEQGYEYLVISDHSKTASYANGQPDEKIQQQHTYVDELNIKFAPFKIFKSIESDILGDGSLDYPDKLLATFDLVIASVHANIKMQEEKAMSRLLNAISNPYTTILGHMTARLLLSRPGYPVDHKRIIEACAEHNVVIEINANPRRLDMDWRWIEYALEMGVMLSINPDAHEIREFNNCKYGVLSAQKGGLLKENNLSSFSLEAFTAFISAKETARKK